MEDCSNGVRFSDSGSRRYRDRFRVRVYPEKALDRLRQQLVDLSTEIPVAFTGLADISTIGGQLGIAGANIASFSENVAMFAATTDATIDNTAMSFGRIAQLTGEGQQ